MQFQNPFFGKDIFISDTLKIIIVNPKLLKFFITHGIHTPPLVKTAMEYTHQNTDFKSASSSWIIIYFVNLFLDYLFNQILQGIILSFFGRQGSAIGSMYGLLLLIFDCFKYLGSLEDDFHCKQFARTSFWVFPEKELL